MERLVNFDLRVNKNNRIQQNDSRAYKELLHQVIAEKLAELDITITPIQNALVLEIPHEEHGAIPIEATFVVKALNLDVLTLGEEYQQKLAVEKAKAEAKAKERE